MHTFTSLLLLPRTVPLYEGAAVCLLSFAGCLGHSTGGEGGPLWIKLLSNPLNQSLCGHVFSLLLDVCLWVSLRLFKSCIAFPRTISVYRTVDKSPTNGIRAISSLLLLLEYTGLYLHLWVSMWGECFPRMKCWIKEYMYLNMWHVLPNCSPKRQSQRIFSRTVREASLSRTLGNSAQTSQSLRICLLKNALSRCSFLLL